MNAQSEVITFHNIDAEQSVLGTILISGDAYDAVSQIIDANHFSEPLHQQIYEVIGNRRKAGKETNPVSILSFLPSDQMVGEITVKQYVDRLWQQAALPVSMLKGSAQSVYEMYLRRVAYTECDGFVSRMADLPPDMDILDEIGAFEEKLSEIRANRLKEDDRRNAGLRYLESMEQAAKRDSIDGVPVCLDEIRRVISEPCFEAGNLYGLLSSSGEGKTSLTIQIIHHALQCGHPVLFLSYDQSEVQISRQMCAQVKGISVGRQRDPRLLSDKEWGMISDFGMWLGERDFEVIKCSNEKAAVLKGYARHFIRKRGNGKTPLVVVDHIGMVTPENDRVDEGRKANSILQIFKTAANDTGAAWLVLNQRNSYGMRRDNPRPIGQDLYGGEGAKQPYDAVIYLYRFKKYFEDRKDVATTDSDWKKIHKTFPPVVVSGEQDLAEIGAIKVRFGNPAVKKNLEFEAPLTRYRSLKQETEQPELLP